jgi:hypothetical protein
MPELMALQRICGLLDRGEIDSAQFLELFTRRMAQGIGCSRAGVRMLIETQAGAACTPWPCTTASPMRTCASRT